MYSETTQQALAAAQADGAHIIDVREPHEYAGGHIPGANLIPLSLVPLRVADVPTDRPVYVVCAAGGRSAQAAQFLAAHGVDARTVAGGTNEWVAAGRPVVTGERASV